MTLPLFVNVVSLLGLAFFLVGAYMSWHAWFAFASRNWPKVQGRMLLSGVYEAEGAPTAYKAHVQYQYAVGNVTYESTRLRFGGVNPFSFEINNAELNAGLRSSEVQVSYDPHNPKRSCLIAGPNEWTLITPVLLLLLGGAMLALGSYPFA